MRTIRLTPTGVPVWTTNFVMVYYPQRAVLVMRGAGASNRVFIVN